MSSAAVPVLASATVDDLLTLICQQLQITNTQQSQAEARYKPVGQVLEMPGSPIAGHRPSVYPQGSLRIGTTVRPLERKEFDLDLVCELETDARRFPDPTILVHGMATYLGSLPAYVGKIRRKNRCVRIVFQDQFHIDVLPACKDPYGGKTDLVVPDCESRGWRASNPKGYAAWFESCSRFVPEAVFKGAEPIPAKEPVDSKPTLKLATQLLKRLRDVKFRDQNELAPVSIVITTLCGLNYSGQDSVGIALLGILQGIVRQIPLQGRLVILNPVNTKEDLSEKWDKSTSAYKAFASAMRGFLDAVQGLYEPQPMEGLYRRLRQMFGEDVSKIVIEQYAQSVERSRSNGTLHVRKHSGILAATGVGSAFVPVRPHTFYGDQLVLEEAADHRATSVGNAAAVQTI